MGIPERIKILRHSIKESIRGNFIIFIRLFEVELSSVSSCLDGAAAEARACENAEINIAVTCFLCAAARRRRRRWSSIDISTISPLLRLDLSLLTVFMECSFNSLPKMYLSNAGYTSREMGRKLLNRTIYIPQQKFSFR